MANPGLSLVPRIGDRLFSVMVVVWRLGKDGCSPCPPTTRDGKSPLLRKDTAWSTYSLRLIALLSFSNALVCQLFQEHRASKEQ